MLKFRGPAAPVASSPRLPAALAVAVALLLAACGAKDAGTSSTGTPSPAGGAGTAGSTAPGTTPGTSRAAATPAAATGAAVPSPGCGTSAQRAADAERRTMTVDGEDRWYLLTVPPAHDGKRPLPLVLDFHGLGEGAEVHTKMSGFGALAAQEGFVVAFPNGQGQPVHWDTRFPPTANHDLDYVDQLLDRLGRDLCLDTSRVYATGLSYGAIMTSFLSCARTDRFAAVAPVAGIQLLNGCTPSRPLPVVTFHGTDDPILRFNGGLGSIPGLSAAPAPGAPTTTAPKADLNGEGYPATVAQWAKNNGCDPTPTDTTLSPEAIHRVYHCPAGRDVEFYILTGGGHAWPGSEFSRSIESVVGHTTFDVDATKQIWQFFQRFQLPASR